MKTKAHFCLILLLVIGPIAIQAQNASYFSWIADSLFESGDFKRSSIYYDSAIRTNTSDYAIYYNASCAHAKSGNIMESIEYLNRSFELGYNDFDWMYYDLDLNVLREYDDYKKLETKYRDQNTIYFFDLIKDLMELEEVSYHNKRISFGTWNGGPNYYEDYLGNYNLEAIYNRLGIDTTDTNLDFSEKTLNFWNCDFNNESESTMIRFLKLGKLEIMGEGAGDLYLADVVIKDILLIGTAFTNIMFENLNQDGLFQIHNRGEGFRILNSNLQFQSKYDYRFNAVKSPDGTALCGLNLRSKPDEPNVFQLKNVTISESDKTDFKSSFLINAALSSFEISESKFAMPLEISGSANKVDFQKNNFENYVDFTEFQFPEFNCYIPYKQFQMSFVDISGFGEDFKVLGINPEDLQDLRTYDQIVNVLKRLHNNYRDRGEISSANQVYRDLKNLEISHLQQLENKNGSERLRLILNQIMGFYTDHGTSPGKAILISIYIILVFSIFYFFYPSEWDKERKSKLVHDLKVFIEKNDHGYLRPLIKLLKGSIVSFLNAFTLSVNAFITLGFGRIPTTGVAKYICIFQGLMGWFLLSLFTVSLINQVLL